MAPTLKQNPLVTAVAKDVLPQVQALLAVSIPRVTAPTTISEASDVPEFVVFAGFLDTVVTQPGISTKNWWVLYLDVSLTSWLLVEEDGVVAANSIVDDNVPGKKRDVIWVKKDASVGLGNRSQTIEGQFLTGEFTRAGDCEAPTGNGDGDGSTGVFCEARTPHCCYRQSRT